MNQRIVAIGVRYLPECPGDPAEVPASISSGIEDRRRVKILRCSHLQVVGEGVAVGAKLATISVDIPSDIEMPIRTKCLRTAVGQIMGEGS